MTYEYDSKRYLFPQKLAENFKFVYLLQIAKLNSLSLRKTIICNLILTSKTEHRFV